MAHPDATIAFTDLTLALLRARSAEVAHPNEPHVSHNACVDARNALAKLDACLQAGHIPAVKAVAKFVLELEEAAR